jgi:integrase
MKGTIRERRKQDGTVVFTCQVEASRDPATNKRRYLTATATTRREANTLLHQMMADIDDTKTSGTDATILTLGELIERWLELGGPAAASTRMVYDGYIKNQIRPHLWDSRLDQLRVADMDRWYVTLRESGLAPASIRKAHTIVRAALAQGVRWVWINVNVAAMAKPPTVPKPVIATPRAADVKRLVEFVARTDLAMATYIRLSGVTGARPGEMCGLHWHDIDFVTGEVTVRRRIMRSSSGMFPRGPDQDRQSSPGSLGCVHAWVASRSPLGV